MGTFSRLPVHTASAIAAESPRLVQWMVTQRCPLSCPHCLATGSPAGPELSLRQGLDLVQQVAAMDVPELLLTGGEPLARPDLPEIIDALAANRVHYSLNTALMPERRARAAMERWPPGFVAVSLDGPEEIHDRFRGRQGSHAQALQSIAYFKELAPGGVAAGTTVTSVNLSALGQTFATVLASGATSWGLHLVVPEGRAARRSDLMLSHDELRQLLRFAAAKRQSFPVTMADEIGYCGQLEPLLRDEPFYCGAGTAQCVVLPAGEVVPCTTLDRSTSAGNIARMPLAQIWRDGFTELRAWQPEGSCRGCEYLPACAGGCWLQRRHGAQCFRPVWQPRSRSLSRSAAALAICLGLAASGTADPPVAVAQRPKRPPAQQITQQMQVLQSSIVRWYAAQVAGPHAPDGKQVLAELQRALPTDPGARYFLAFARDKRPKDLARRAAAIEQALQTKQISLCLVGLAWRDLTQLSLESHAPRSDADRQIVRRVMTALHTTAEAWRRRIFTDKLDPFLRRPSHYRHFFLSKAGPRPWMRKLLHVERVASKLARKRGFTRPRGDITEEFLRQHAHGEVMDLRFTGGPELRLLRGGKQVKARGTLRLFDVLLVGSKHTAITFPAGNAKLAVTLPAGTELTYADVLHLLWQQNEQVLRQLARSLLTTRRPREALPLTLPALRAMERELTVDRSRKSEHQLQRVSWWLVDLYLF